VQKLTGVENQTVVFVMSAKQYVCTSTLTSIELKTLSNCLNYTCFTIVIYDHND